MAGMQAIAGTGGNAASTDAGQTGTYAGTIQPQTGGPPPIASPLSLGDGLSATAASTQGVRRIGR